MEKENDLTTKIYNKEFLLELGSCYASLLKVLSRIGKNPFPDAEVFPVKCFTLVYKKAMHLGVPEELDSRIRALMDSVTVEAWEAAFNEPCPTRERSWFLLNL